MSKRSNRPHCVCESPNRGITPFEAPENVRRPLGYLSQADPSGEIQILGNSLAAPKLSAKCCEANVAHSSQMKTLLLSGPRLARKASHPPQPPTRDRTSFLDLPQNEQVLHGAAARVIWEAPSFSRQVSTSLRGISSPPGAGSLAERVFQSAKPNCRATISRHVLWESETFRSTRESRRDFAIVLAFFRVNIV
jgi:hypothetical protein